MTLELQVKTSYGRDRIYPINETARKLADLMGRKTFDVADLAKLKDLGFEIKWIPIVIPTPVAI